MNDKKIPLVARLALKLKWITSEQLASVADKIDPHQPIGDLLVTEGLLNERQRDRLEALKLELLAKHRDRRASEETKPHQDTSLQKPDSEQKPSRNLDVIHTVAAQSSQEINPVAPETFGDGAQEASAVHESDSAAAQMLESNPEPAESGVEASTVVDSESLGLGLSIQSDPLTSCDALEEILRRAVGSGASDIHIHSEGRLAFRVGGELIVDDQHHLSAEAAERLVVSALSQRQSQDLRRFGELDFCLERENVGRFRANAYRQQRG
ncbi:hypothetical protein MK280_15520, partial [Myxococcota bacterium]|nr:hypothetical protein [Myxococcota bacterium]